MPRTKRGYFHINCVYWGRVWLAPVVHTNSCAKAMGDEAMTAQSKDLNAIRIFAKPGGEAGPRAKIAGVAPRAGFDYPATPRGSTANFNVYYDDTTLGANGAA